MHAAPLKGAQAASMQNPRYKAPPVPHHNVLLVDHDCIVICSVNHRQLLHFKYNPWT
jgi:hypothetical protein